MSHVSEDEKSNTKLQEWKEFNDSKESKSPSEDYKKKAKEYKNDDYNNYDISDDKELDDSDW